MFPRKAWGQREPLVTVGGGGGVPNLQCRAGHREKREGPESSSHGDATHSEGGRLGTRGAVGCQTEKEEEMGQDG